MLSLGGFVWKIVCLLRFESTYGKLSKRARCFVFGDGEQWGTYLNLSTYYVLENN